MLSFHEGLIPIAIVGIIFGCIAVLGVVVIFANLKRRGMEIEAYKKAIEKGLPMPELNITKSPVRTLKAALIWIAIGIGLFILIAMEGDFDGIAVSFIPILIGIALIISYYIEKKSANGNGTGVSS